MQRKMCEGNTKDTIAHDDGIMKAAIRLHKGNTKCDFKADVKIEAESLEIKTGQAGGRGNMGTDSFR